MHFQNTGWASDDSDSQVEAHILGISWPLGSLPIN
jgi:hypothetical protein